MKRIIKKLLIAYLKRQNGNFKKNNLDPKLLINARSELQKIHIKQERMSSQADEWWRSEEMQTLQQLLQSGGLEKFLRLPTICETMYEFYAPMLIKEYFWLIRKSRKEGFSLSKLISEDETGAPIPFLLNSSTSGNLIHHVYHYLKYRDFCGLDFNQIKHILEFGGGYGSLCRVFFRDGYQGNYSIVDFKTFNVLQAYFLNSIGISAQIASENTAQHLRPNVVCATKFRFTGEEQKSNTLFIATWSLSETGIEVRNAYKKEMDQCGNFMVAFRDTFEGVDNLTWFTSYMKARMDVSWRIEKIVHIPNSYYLFGKPIIQDA